MLLNVPQEQADSSHCLFTAAPGAEILQKAPRPGSGRATMSSHLLKHIVRVFEDDVPFSTAKQF
ncbi:MAG: hypothetical protein R3B91_13640 [Planctomycetaceae bacterium]